MPNGLLPRYVPNPAHNPRAPLPRKTPEPADAALRTYGGVSQATAPAFPYPLAGVG